MHLMLHAHCLKMPDSFHSLLYCFTFAVKFSSLQAQFISGGFRRHSKMRLPSSVICIAVPELFFFFFWFLLSECKMMPPICPRRVDTLACGLCCISDNLICADAPTHAVFYVSATYQVCPWCTVRLSFGSLFRRRNCFSQIHSLRSYPSGKWLRGIALKWFRKVLRLSWKWTKGLCKWCRMIDCVFFFFAVICRSRDISSCIVLRQNVALLRSMWQI